MTVLRKTNLRIKIKKTHILIYNKRYVTIDTISIYRLPKIPANSCRTILFVYALDNVWTRFCICDQETANFYVSLGNLKVRECTLYKISKPRCFLRCLLGKTIFYRVCTFLNYILRDTSFHKNP